MCMWFGQVREKSHKGVMLTGLAGLLHSAGFRFDEGGNPYKIRKPKTFINSTE